MNTVKVALIQQSNSIEVNDNIAKLESNIRFAAGQGAELILLQELHNSLYFCQVEDVNMFDLAESIPGPSTAWLGKLAAEMRVIIVGSLFERRAPGLYHNTAVVLDKDGTLAGKYRKMHIPDDPSFYEKFYFTPGDTGFEPIKTSIGKLGVLVCWDQWFPEAARLMAMRGANLLVYPTAIGWDVDDSKEEQERQLNAWATIQRGHAVANGLPVLAINRVGMELAPAGAGKGILFWGNSFVAGPQGEVIAQAGCNEEKVLFAEVCTRQTETVRRIWPFFRDRRVDAYNGIQERYLDL